MGWKGYARNNPARRCIDGKGWHGQRVAVRGCNAERFQSASQGGWRTDGEALGKDATRRQARCLFPRLGARCLCSLAGGYDADW